jgi:hypothetical protein
VYSSKGEHKRKLTLPQGVRISVGSVITSFDDQSLLLYDHNKLSERIVRKNAGDNRAFSPQSNDSAYVLISKIDGRLLEYVEMPSPTMDLSIRTETGGLIFTNRVHIVKNAEGFFLCNPGNDTIYLYKKDKSLTPILRKTPLMIDGSMHVLNNCVDAGGYQFMNISRWRMNVGETRSEKNYMRNKETGEIFQQKLILPDYKGKEFFICARGFTTRYLENGYRFTLGLSELKQAYRENRLSGELKKLVATLDEDRDNDVFMFLNFK